MKASRKLYNDRWQSIEKLRINQKNFVKKKHFEATPPAAYDSF